MSYIVEINEEQRQFILTALNATRRHGYLGADKQGREEIDMLAQMFDGLKDDEGNYCIDEKGRRQNIIHGFCL